VRSRSLAAPQAQVTRKLKNPGRGRVFRGGRLHPPDLFRSVVHRFDPELGEFGHALTHVLDQLR
jgi:hypothetical protein